MSVLTKTDAKYIKRAERVLREAVATLQTYWNTSGDALSHAATLLLEHGLRIGEQLTFTEDDYDSRRYTFKIVDDESGQAVDNSVLVWSVYKLGSGRVEITAYLS